MADTTTSLEPEEVSLDLLTPLEGNPRRGDVEAVKASFTRFGQRLPLVARHKGDVGEVIAGNHRYYAAKELGWPTVEVVWFECDDETAKAFALADNRTADLAYYDNTELLAMLQSLSSLEGTGYSPTDLEDLVAMLTPPPLDEMVGEDSEAPTNAWDPVIHIPVPPAIESRWRRLLSEEFENHATEAFVALLNEHDAK
jgi:ParB-like chromosome segregation protein Spo0J